MVCPDYHHPAGVVWNLELYISELCSVKCDKIKSNWLILFQQTELATTMVSPHQQGCSVAYLVCPSLPAPPKTMQPSSRHLLNLRISVLCPHILYIVLTINDLHPL